MTSPEFNPQIGIIELLNYSCYNSYAFFLLLFIVCLYCNYKKVCFEFGPSQNKTSPPPKTFPSLVASESPKAKWPWWCSSLRSIFLLQTKHHGVAGQGECNRNDIMLFSILKFMLSPCKVWRGDKNCSDASDEDV